ncbi:hypothetical protein FO519_007591 [Halicephalobus sp. NKZ332]|nr:hypothetical protein FO519_007591 [Halicephalobus sp. NKZ332]
MTWSFIFNAHMSFWKPVPLWPFYMVYSVGFWRNIPKDFSYIPVIILNSICCGMGFSIYISAIHRYIQVSPFSWFYRLHSNLYFRFTIYLLVFIVIQLIIVLPLYLLKIPPEVLEKESLRITPQLEYFFISEASIFGYLRSTDIKITNFFCVIIGVFGVLILSIVLLILNYFRILKKNKAFLEQRALRLQRMLLTSLLIQVLFSIIILILPIALSLVFCIIGFRWTSAFSVYAIMFTSLHAIVEFTCTMVSINNEMGTYKWYLVHQMSWIFVFDLHMSTWKPVPLWPFYLIYNVGFWRNISTGLSFVPVIMLVSICCGMGFSIYISAIHRYVQADPFSWLYRQYSNSCLRFTLYIFAFIATQLVIALPMYLLKIPPEVLQEDTLHTAPQLEYFFTHEPSIFGYRRSSKVKSGTFMYVLIGVFGALILSIILAMANYVRIMRKNKNSLEHVILKYQKMLLKSLAIQVSFTIVGLILPITLCLVFCIIGFRWTQTFSIYAIMFMSLHAIIEFTCTIVTIKPYRVFQLSCQLPPKVGKTKMIFLLIPLLLFFEPVSSDTCAWDNCPPFVNDGKTVNLHIVAHTHDDMGWLKTADDYFSGYNPNQVNTAVMIIIDTVVESLKRDPNRKFCYAEVGFLTRWLETRSQEEVQDLINLVNNGQLELIGGGWVQPDEAASHYIELIDMYTLGSRRLNHTFGSSCSKPRTGWQIDPFGHSREHANLLTMMGHESVYFAREHHLEHDMRRQQQKLEFKWWPSDENPSRNLLTGVFYAHYNQPGGFCFDFHCNDSPVIINPNFDSYNADDVVNRLTNYVEKERLPTMPHKHVLFMMGDDFQYQNAEQNFRNLDNLIWLIGNRTQYKIFYSTPACYTKAILGSGVAWSNKTYDFFPYGSDGNSYWTGYFTSKPAFKGLIRSASNFLNTVRTLNSLSLNPSLSEYTTPEEKLERAVGLTQHHDGVTGTSKEHVTQDYEYRIFQGMDSIQPVYQAALQAISQRTKGNTVSFPAQTFCRQLNESACDLTKNNAAPFSIVLTNGNSQDVQQLVRIPIYTDTVTLTDSSNQGVSTAKVVPTFNNSNQITNDLISPYQLEFVANIPALGFSTYFVTSKSKEENNVPVLKEQKFENHPKSTKATSITNGQITVNFDDKNLLTSITTKDGKTYPLKQRFMYYEGHDNNGRASGAYVFRPQLNLAASVNNNPSISTVGMEARQVFSDWVSQTIRIHPTDSYVEFEWTVGPLPEVDRNGKKYGKELITRYEASGIKSGSVFYTDSNGRQLIQRKRNWNPDYTYDNAEPVAANYFPVTSTAIIKDNNTAMAVLIDRSQAAGSIIDNSLEFLLHRRNFYDDGFGVGEALDEPGNDKRGLVVRGIHRIFFSDPATIASLHRTGQYGVYNSPVVSFSKITSYNDYNSNFITKYSGLSSTLPFNVRILTLKQLDSSTLILRLEHIFAVNEDSDLSKPVTIDISKIFKDLKVNSVKEMSLAANSYIDGSTSTSVTLNPQDIKTFQISVSM